MLPAEMKAGQENVPQLLERPSWVDVMYFSSF